ncbi:hypothetical protein LU11_gp155 [Pseudomonas phage Lu11]|uniref:hypothetical protein n=1 Tax=Pseudomonas phage Lu11 TaxID=1161927 RepID=UPI00025F17C0|nr:hypothetical protein LU11_gp155 [Pseudomonas phage Lu11]AFH14686.1 hypothetical protein Lu11_0153 [Pseudomonas phage Lu11]
MGRFFIFYTGNSMFNASGIVQNALNGIHYRDFLRDLTIAQQMSDNQLSPAYVSNIVAAMGCRLTLEKETIKAVPFHDTTPANVPSYMGSNPRLSVLPYINANPFVILPEWNTLYSRLEVALSSNSPAPAIVYRDIWQMSKARKLSLLNAPAQMICFPVMCLTDGNVKQVRLSFYNFIKTPAAFFNGAPCVISGQRLNKRIFAVGANVEHSFDGNAAKEDARAILAELHSEYAQPNHITEAQGYLMRALLDVRKRNADHIQDVMVSIHTDAKATRTLPAPPTSSKA